MKEKMAKVLVEMGRDYGLDLKIYEGYSGRGMYGSETWGISGEDCSAASLLKLVLEAGLAGDLESYFDVGYGDTNDAWNVGYFREDVLGLGRIVY